MDKAVIIGGYEFLGFYFCSAFLEKGCTVECVSIETGDESIIDEKRFTVGRNANFSETSLPNWAESTQSEDDNLTVVVSLYDLFLKKENDRLMGKIESEVAMFLEQNDRNNSVFIFILPIQYLLISDSSNNMDSFLTMLEKIKKRNRSFKCVYIPTIYGPWQPIENMFQQVFQNELNGTESLHLSKNEWVFDALYILDAIGEMMKVIEDDTMQTCVLRSRTNDHWKKCAEFLEIDPCLYQGIMSEMRLPEDIDYVNVPESIGYVQGLTQQRQHLQRITGTDLEVFFETGKLPNE